PHPRVALLQIRSLRGLRALVSSVRLERRLTTVGEPCRHPLLSRAASPGRCGKRAEIDTAIRFSMSERLSCARPRSGACHADQPFEFMMDFADWLPHFRGCGVPEAQPAAASPCRVNLLESHVFKVS